MSAKTEVTTDDKQVKEIKRLTAAVSNLRQMAEKASRPGEKSKNKKKRKKAKIIHNDDNDNDDDIQIHATQVNSLPLCEYCGERGHRCAECFHNPACTEKAKKKFVDFFKRHPGWVKKPPITSFSANVNVTTFELNANPATLAVDGMEFECDPSLMALEDRGKSIMLLRQILLDSGSDQCILNRFFRHLFISLNPISFRCTLSGIGGTVDVTISHIGRISFMNRTIDNVYYCSKLSKSIISESILCRDYNFKIVKENCSCIITDLLHSVTTEVTLGFRDDSGSGHYLLPITLFAHSPLIHSINLASVRPSNPLTLWHSRFGHSYTGLIQRMARLAIYSDRGLKIPPDFLHRIQDPDLCDICAQGKPTRDMSYTPQVRSSIKGKLWYFDVSGGGELTPALITLNKYTFMFCDSCTRMYFDYYTRNVDDVTVLRVLKLFADEVLSTLQREDDEFIFLRADNGQLDTIGVKAYTRKQGVITQFIQPYHPNMNGFVERSFRSVKDLARCMLLGAGLPEPYWERAQHHARLIRNILPNQSATGHVRESYFLWYGLTFDYARLRTWGSRSYAINHTGLKDYGARSVVGIFVGFDSTNPITITYELYLPSKNVFITSGDVVFCEHVDRSEPERLLPPRMLLPPGQALLDPKDYQHLVDTVHMDNEEGVLYKVLRVYKFRNNAVVDRVLFLADRPNEKGGVIDMVFLDNIVEYPVLQGRANPRHLESVQLDANS